MGIPRAARAGRVVSRVSRSWSQPESDRAGRGAHRLYKPRDTHWNSRGNRLAGELLAAELLRRGLAER